MKKLLNGLLVVVLLLSYADSYAKEDEKKVKKGKSTTVIKKVSDYDKLVKEATETAKSSFFSIFKTKDKLYLEIPLSYLGREMLLGSTMSEISDPSFADIGYKSNTPLMVSFTKNESSILLNLVNTYTECDYRDANLKEAVDKAYADPIFMIYDIKTYNNDSTAVVIDATKLFFENLVGIESLRSTKNFLFDSSAKYIKEKSFIEGGVKSFADNLSVKSTMSYEMTIRIFGFTLAADVPVTTKVTRTLMLLPDSLMRSRISDSRVGIFATKRQYLTSTIDGLKQYTLANRWRLEPIDEAAYQRGEVVEVKKPIVFYVDNAFPELWRQPIKDGVERWNQAFEKIGFKNVIKAVDYPTNDPSFDPDNLKYSCIRYVPKATANAMGPSWVDPRTGEIINASVIVYNDIISLINSWRFVQTAQLDERVRSKKMPESIIKESMAYVIAHEIGHCIGFMHNMSSSAVFKVEDLRSPEFTQKYGTTASIMDYARFNYVAQPSDKGVRLTPPDLGEWDYFMIKWNYQPIFTAKSHWEEAAIVESWVDEKIGDPVYRYGRQQLQLRIDPSSLEEDLGDDPIKASEYGIKNLKYILANLDNWITDDSDYSHREKLFEEICDQYVRYVTNVMYNVGGIYLTDVKEGTNDLAKRPVDRETQKKSLKWVLDQIKDCQWLDDANRMNNFRLDVKPSISVMNQIVYSFEKSAANVILCSHISNKPYTIEEFINDIYHSAFNGTINNKKPSNAEMMLQSFLAGEAVRAYSLKDGNIVGITNNSSLPSIDELLKYNLYNEPLLKLYSERLRKIEAENGVGSVAQMLQSNEFGNSPGFLGIINTSNIDNRTAIFQLVAKRIQKLLTAKVNSISDMSTQAHYNSLLVRLNKALADVQ